jgi:hypothetical protein
MIAIKHYTKVKVFDQLLGLSCGIAISLVVAWMLSNFAPQQISAARLESEFPRLCSK